MSKHNYSKYSKNLKNDDANVLETTVEEEVGMPVFEVETDVNESVQETVEVVETSETVEATEPVVLVKTVDGVVANCAKLNVRAKPDTDAAIVCVLVAGSEIEINISKSTNEWFNVCTAVGVEGYCMRKFVNANL